MKDIREFHNTHGVDALNALLSDPANFAVMPPLHEAFAQASPAQHRPASLTSSSTSTPLPAATITVEPPLPRICSITELVTLPPDPAAILLGERLLCRGGALLMVGPSGVGKSSMSMQQDLCWAAGREAFGILPARPLRILTIQAENDEGDLYEMSKGVSDGIEFLPEEWDMVMENLFYVTEVARSGDSFLLMLDRLLTQHPCDLVRIDPLFAFYGAKIEDSEKLSAFLRGGLNPLLHRHNVGLILAHHTPKTTTRDTSNWTHTDYSYAGAGGAELTNWARAMLVLDATHTPGSFRLIAAKRGARIGWRDSLSGEREFIRYYRHSRQDGIICWEDGDENEVAIDTARKKAAKNRAATINPIPLIEEAVPLSRPIGRKELEAQVNAKGAGLRATKDALDRLLDAEEPSYFIHREKRRSGRDRILISRLPPSQREMESVIASR